MASANVDLLRSIYTTWERGDFTSAEWAYPEIEYVAADGPAPGGETGGPGWPRPFRDWLSVWEEWRVEAEEYHELDGERVLVLFHFSARGKTSGLEVRHIGTKRANLFHLGGGKVMRLVQYSDRERGLADLGLVPRPATTH